MNRIGISRIGGSWVGFGLRTGLHIPVRQAQVERRSFARFERFRTADLIRSLVRYRLPSGMDAQPAVARSVGRDRMDVPVLLRTDVLAGRIVGRNFAVAQVALFQFRPPRAVLTCKNEMLRGRAEYIETDPVAIFELPASVLADRGPRGGQIEHEFHLSVGSGAETLGRRIALAASGHKKSRPPKGAGRSFVGCPQTICS